ncbi:MAG: PTS lactose/cellobiose transporter subunit IIA [Fusobacteriaceae bacterium]
MELVGNAGESRSLAFEALNAAKKGGYEEAEKKLQESKEKMLRAHHIQTELICKEADGEKVELGLIMVHAQDHLMTAILARDLITEMIEVYKKIK